MIQKHADDVDADLYIYRTKLNFAHEFADKVLQQVLEDESAFERMNRYDNNSDFKTLARKIGKEKAREVFRRKNQVDLRYPGLTPITFRQLFLTKDLNNEFLSVTPEFFKMIADNEPRTLLQVSDSGDMLPAHRGHQRKCSLMMILQENAQETHWYREKIPFETIDPLRIPDLDKVEHVVTAVMQPYVWYMFNHKEWHSVHNFVPGSKRISIGLDFFSIEAPELVKLIKEYEVKNG